MTIQNRPIKINESPSPAQIHNAQSVGWEYVGEGYFIKPQYKPNSREMAESGDWLGYFTNEGFKVE